MCFPARVAPPSTLPYIAFQPKRQDEKVGQTMMWNTSSLDFLEEWNQTIATKYIWISVLLVIFLVIGIVGNILVVLVYKFKMTGKIDDRFFIPVLALIDLLACVLLIALSLTRTLSPVTFSDAVSCKCLNFSAHASSSASLFMLVVIAVHRYQKICRPLGSQMQEKHKYIAIATACIGATVLFSPLLAFYEITPVYRSHGNRNITGFVCSTERHLKEKTKSIMTFQAITFLLYLVTIVAISVLYVFVSKAILERLASYKRRKERKKEKKLSRSLSQSDVILHQVATNDSDLPYACDTLKRRRLSQTGKGEGHFAVYRYSYIFMAITVKAVISYIGPWIIVIYESTTSGADIEKMDLLILKRMYILSHVTNPVIFGLLDRKFRTALLEWLCGLKRKIYRVSVSGSS